MREKIRNALKKISAEVDLRDSFAFGGIGCVAYGLAQIYPPTAWIVTGAALFWLGVKR